MQFPCKHTTHPPTTQQLARSQDCCFGKLVFSKAQHQEFQNHFKICQKSHCENYSWMLLWCIRTNVDVHIQDWKCAHALLEVYTSTTVVCTCTTVVCICTTVVCTCTVICACTIAVCMHHCSVHMHMHYYDVQMYCTAVMCIRIIVVCIWTSQVCTCTVMCTCTIVVCICIIVVCTCTTAGVHNNY